CTEGALVHHRRRRGRKVENSHGDFQRGFTIRAIELICRPGTFWTRRPKRFGLRMADMHTEPQNASARATPPLLGRFALLEKSAHRFLWLAAQISLALCRLRRDQRRVEARLRQRAKALLGQSDRGSTESREIERDAQRLFEHLLARRQIVDESQLVSALSA